MGTPVLAAQRDDRILLAARISIEEVHAEPVVELRSRDRAGELGPHDELTNVLVGFQQNGRREEDVVNADDSLLVQLHVVEKRRAAVEREVQRVMQIVIQVGAGTDDKVNETAIHQLDHAAAEAGRRERAGNGQADRRVVLRSEHLLREDVTGLGQTPGVERLETAVDEMSDLRAPARTVVLDWLAGEVVLGVVARGPGRSMWH